MKTKIIAAILLIISFGSFYALANEDPFTKYAEKNVLMADITVETRGLNEGDVDGYSLNADEGINLTITEISVPETVLGGYIYRSSIISVTFLDTLKDATDTAWDVSALKDGSVMAWVIPNGDYYDLYIGGEGGVTANKDSFGLFSDYINMRSIDFNGCFDVSFVSDMSFMFAKCNSLMEINMDSLNTSNVKTMHSMFSRCASLETIDLHMIDLSSLTDIEQMFCECTNLKKVTLGEQDTARLTNMEAAFYRCSSLENIDFENLNTKNVVNMHALFGECSSIKRVSLQGMDMGSVETMEDMFNSCISLNEIDLDGIDVGHVKNMNGLFSQCKSIKSFNLSGLHLNHVTDMGYMFDSCELLEEVSLENVDAESVENMECMFVRCKSLKTAHLDSIDTSRVTSMKAMFAQCDQIEEIDLSCFDTSSVTDMSLMFAYCSNLESVNVSSFDTSCVIDMNGMFGMCPSLTEIDLSSFDTSCVEDIASMFEGDVNLSHIKIDKFDLSSAKRKDNMFLGCDKLEAVPQTVTDTSFTTQIHGEPQPFEYKKIENRNGYQYDDTTGKWTYFRAFTKEYTDAYVVIGLEIWGANEKIISVPQLYAAIKDPSTNYETALYDLNGFSFIMDGKEYRYDTVWTNHLQIWVNLGDEGKQLVEALAHAYEVTVKLRWEGYEFTEILDADTLEMSLKPMAQFLMDEDIWSYAYVDWAQIEEDEATCKLTVISLND